MIRFEILLPLFYNDGRPIEREKFVHTDDELVRQFGATSTDTVVVRGHWVYQGTLYHDQLIRGGPMSRTARRTGNSCASLRLSSRRALSKRTFGSRPIGSTSFDDATGFDRPARGRAAHPGSEAHGLAIYPEGDVPRELFQVMQPFHG